MEPSVKRRRLSQHPQLWHDEAEGGDEEWEEYGGDDDSGEPAAEQREGSIEQEQDDGYQLAIEKAYADSRFQATMARIYKKYGRDFEGIGDEIDLSTGEIVVNNGHIENMRHEVDVGVVPGNYSQDIDDDNDDDNEDGILLGDLTDGENGQYFADKLGPNDDIDDDESQSWTSDAEDGEMMSEDMHLAMLQRFGKGSTDGMPNYDATAEGVPSVMSGLYGGGGLRYASGLNDFGASPFALSPWDMLPQTLERYAFPKEDSGSSIRSPGYRLKEREPDERSKSKRARLSTSRAWPGSKQPRAIPPARTLNTGSPIPTGSNKRPADSSVERLDKHPNGKRPMPMGSNFLVEAMDDSDTDDDDVFSSGDLSGDTDTGDTTDEVGQSNMAARPSSSGRIIPDSQESYAPLDAQSDKPPGKPNHLQPAKSKPQDFDSACVLSDDESPLYSQPPAPGNTINPIKPANPTPTANALLGHNVNADGTVPKRGRGRPRKWPPGYRPPRSRKKKPKPSLQELSDMPGFPSGSTMPVMPSFLSPLNVSKAPTAPATQPVRVEAVPGQKRKRGRPRKYPIPGSIPQQNPNSPLKQTQQPIQQPLLETLHPDIQQQAFQYPFHPLFQQPLFQLPQQMGYQAWQHPYLAQPMFQFQQQMFRHPIQQLVQQPIMPYSPAQPHTPSQPIKRKRGRPRKYPIRFDPMYPGSGMNRKKASRQLPLGLQNSMTALLSGQSGRTMGSEDAWYGVARQLAQDIACLQGGSLLTNQFHAETHSASRKSHSPSRNFEGQIDEGSVHQQTDDEQRRVTELSEISDAEAAATETQASQPENVVSDLHGLPLVDQPSFESTSFEPNVLDPALLEPALTTDMLDNASFEGSRPDGPSAFDSDPFDSDMIDPALADKAVTDEASTKLHVTEPSVAEAGSMSTEIDAFDPSLIDPALLVEVSDSPAGEDDTGFVMMESPKSMVRSVQPTPSPPSPPPSSQSMSPLKEPEHFTPSPAKIPAFNSHTPTSLESADGATSKPHEPGNYDLPSSPEPICDQVTTAVVPVNEPAAECKEIAGHTHSHVKEHTPAFSPCREKTQPPDCAVIASSTNAEELPPPGTPGTTIEPIVDEQEITVGNKDGLESLDKAVESPLTVVNSLLQPNKTPERPERPDKQLPLLPESHQAHQIASAVQMKPSPITTRPRTPEPPKPMGIPSHTPVKLPAGRSPKVPRSAERCTPIFLESPIFVRSPVRSPPKKRPTIERRTMGDLKQAILEPWQKTKEPRPTIQQPKVKPIEQEISHLSSSGKSRTKLPHSPARPISTSSKTDRPSASKPPTPVEHGSKSRKKSGSRRSLLSLFSGDASTKGFDDEVDELDDSFKSKPPSSSSSSTKPSKTSASNISRDKPGSLSNTESHAPFKEKKSHKGKPHEEPIRNGKEKERDKKKKKRRHTDGPRSKTASGDKECGVDGYTCNKDFCFTCL